MPRPDVTEPARRATFGRVRGLAAVSAGCEPHSTAVESPGLKDGRWSHPAEQPPSTATTPSFSISRTCRSTTSGGRRQGRESRRADPCRLRRAARLLRHHGGLPARGSGNDRRGRNQHGCAGRARGRPQGTVPGTGGRRRARRLRSLGVRRRGAGRSAIVGHRGGPPRRELRRPAGHLPQRRRHRRCARRGASLLGVALDRPRGGVPRRPGHRRLRGRAGRGRATDGGRRVGGRAVHGRPGDGPAAPGRARRRAWPRRRGGIRRRGPRPLRRGHRELGGSSTGGGAARPTSGRPA